MPQMRVGFKPQSCIPLRLAFIKFIITSLFTVQMPHTKFGKDCLLVLEKKSFTDVGGFERWTTIDAKPYQ